MNLQQTVLVKIEKQYTLTEFKDHIQKLIDNSTDENYETIRNIYLWFSTIIEVEMDCEHIVKNNKVRVIRALDCIHRIKPNCLMENCVCNLLIDIYEYYLDYARSQEFHLRRSG